MKKGLVYRMCAYNKAISEPKRMMMIKILGSTPEHTLSVSDLANILGISQPAATKHLQILHNVDLVHRTRVGASVFYRLDHKALEDYRRQLDYAFAHVYSACPNNFQCDDCQYADTCV
jgi:ArsR family transcriptional regulator, arsenate/arsenite/antimonite-responsive transcriptional repressor